MKNKPVVHTKDCIFNGHEHCICKPTHTPTPWTLKTLELMPGVNGKIAKEDAAFICRAVNSHEIMYEALQACLNSEYVDQYGTHIPVIKGELRQQIAQAIAKAEGK